MTGTGETPTPPGGDTGSGMKNKFAKFVAHPVFTVIAILAAIFTVILGVRTLWFTDTNSANVFVFPPTAATSASTVAGSSDSAASTTPDTAGTTSHSPAPEIAVGDCFNDGGQKVPCTAIHRTEVPPPRLTATPPP